MGAFTTFFTKAFIIGIIVFIVFMIFGIGGGFSAIWKSGKIANQLADILSSIPVWFYVVIALIWLSKAMFSGGRR
jgi:ABC-type Na+ efflux pump permease subunit